MNKELLNRKIEETFKSIEGIKKAEANPFIYNKIVGRIGSKKTKEAFKIKQNAYILRFAVMLIAALLLNVYTYFTYSKSENTYNKTLSAYNEKINNEREANLKSFAKEYSLTGTTYNY